MNAPQIAGWDERATFMALDVLLARHHLVAPPTRVKSMKAVAERLIAQAEADLQKWIEPEK
jgi:hypothetical protein